MPLARCLPRTGIYSKERRGEVTNSKIFEVLVGKVHGPLKIKIQNPVRRGGLEPEITRYRARARQRQRWEIDPRHRIVPRFLL
jgi:hypothetical protein